MNNILIHYGVGPDNNPPGRGSGRYPKGSGKNPRKDRVQKHLITKNDVKGYSEHTIKELQSFGIKVDSSKNLYFPKGMEIQRVSLSKNENDPGRIYASFLKNDNYVYSSGEFWEYAPLEVFDYDKDLYLKKYKLKKELKVLNPFLALNIVNDNKDKKVKDLLSKIENTGVTVSQFSDDEYKPIENLQRQFDKAFKDTKNNKLQEAMIKKGYDATVDAYDAGLGYGYTDMPVIVFNPKSSLELISNKKIFEYNKEDEWGDWIRENK